LAVDQQRIVDAVQYATSTSVVLPAFNADVEGFIARQPAAGKVLGLPAATI
jgi:hypothetical protein